MNDYVKVSVIVPVYNVEDYLYDCLNSLICQSLKEIEIICVDDCSTDSSSTILEYFQKKDDRIKIYVNEHNKGQGASRNTGLEHASGEYIQFLDSDDWLNFEALEELYSRVKKEDADLIMYKMINYDQKSGEFFKTAYYSMSYMDSYVDTVLTPKTLGDELIFRLPNSPCNKLFKKSLLDDNAIRFSEGLIFEDNPFYFEVMYSSEKILFSDKYLYNRCIRPGSTMTTFSKNLMDTIEISDIVLSYFLEKNIYPSCKKDVVNYVLLVLFDKFYKIPPLYKEEYYCRMREKIRKYEEEYGLRDDFINLSYSIYKILYQYVTSSEDIDEYHAMIQKNKDLKRTYPISVIMPHYNSKPEDLIRALNSLKNQTFPFNNLEVIVVDDASTIKDSLPHLHLFSDAYRNVRLICLDENGGSGNARNKALDMAHGKYIMFLDHDDYYMPHACEILYKTIHENNLELVCGNYVNITRNGRKVDWTNKFNAYLTKMDNITDNREGLKVDPSIWTKIYKKEFLTDKNIRFKDYRCGQDLVFNQETLFNANGLAFIDETIVVYEVREKKYDCTNSISSNNSLPILVSLMNVYKESNKLFKKYDEDYIHISLNVLEYFVNSRLLNSSLDYDEFCSLFEDSSYLFREYQDNPNVYKSSHEDLFQLLSQNDFMNAYELYLTIKNT